MSGRSRSSRPRRRTPTSATHWPTLDARTTRTTEYRKALDMNPSRAEMIHVNWAILLDGRGQRREAIEHLRQAAAINPDCAAAYYNLGGVLVKQRSFPEAIEAYHKCLAIKPDYAEAHNNLGTALVDCGRLDEAIAEYRKALAVQPDYAAASGNLEKALRLKSEQR